MESSTAFLNNGAPLAVSGEAAAVRGPDDAADRPRLFSRRRVVRVVAVVMLAGVAGGLLHLRVWPPFAAVMSASMSPTI